MSDDTRTELAKHVEGTRDALDVLASILFDFDNVETEDVISFLEYMGVDDIAEDDEYGVQEAARDFWYEWPLEVYQTGKRYLDGGWDATGTVVVFSTGGPHVEYKDGRIHGYWGGEEVVLPATAETDALIDEMFEGYI